MNETQKSRFQLLELMVREVDVSYLFCIYVKSLHVALTQTEQKLFNSKQIYQCGLGFFLFEF